MLFSRFIVFALNTFRSFVNCFSYRFRIKVVDLLFVIGITLMPRYKKIANKNLQQVFPEKDQAWRNKIIRQHCTVLARLFVDFLRIPDLNSKWISEHIEFPQEEEFSKAVHAENKKGAFVMTGHLGSFELTTLASVRGGAPVCIVVRNLKQPVIDKWWNDIRSTNGNSTMSRKGAVRGMLRCINSGQAIGYLFDQNVTRANAIFVNWFGRPAATSKAFGLLAMKYKTPVVILCLRTTGDDKYKAVFHKVETDDLYANSDISDEEGGRIITERSVSILEKLIKEEPAEWFWFHRRWRTTEREDIPENFYH